MSNQRIIRKYFQLLCGIFLLLPSFLHPKPEGHLVLLIWGILEHFLDHAVKFALIPSPDPRLPWWAISPSCMELAPWQSSSAFTRPPGEAALLVPFYGTQKWELWRLFVQHHTRSPFGVLKWEETQISGFPAPFLVSNMRIKVMWNRELRWLTGFCQFGSNVEDVFLGIKLLPGLDFGRM